MDQGRAAVASGPAGIPARARWALAVVPVLFTALFFGWPLGAILGRGLSLGAIGDALGDAHTRSVLWFTVWQAAVCAAAAVAIGLVPAYVLSRYRVPGRRLLLALVTVPFMLPTVVVGSAFLALLPSSMHRTVPAVLIAHVWVNLAVVVRTVGASVAQMDPRLGDAAATLGASPWRVMRHVTLPLLRPALWASASVVFLFCFTSFGIVRLVGGPSHPTLEVEIWRRTTQALDLRTAAALAVLQLVIVVGLTVVWSGQQARTSSRTRMRTHAVLRRARTGGQRVLVWATAVVTAAVVLAPLVVMVERSMSTAASGPARHSLDAWRAVLGIGSSGGRPAGGAQPVVADPWATVLTSLRIAVVASLIAIVVGTLAACAVAYARRAGRLLDVGLMLPLGTSAVTIGFGLIITFNRGWWDLRNNWVMLPIGQALVAVPFVVRVILPTMRAIEPGLREAAATLGASPWHVWREIDLPVLRRAMGAGAGFAFAISVGEFGASSFLTRIDNETAPIAIGRLIARPSMLNLAQAYALATVLAVITLVVIVVVDRLRGERGASF